jgi:hypothetical protein
MCCPQSSVTSSPLTRLSLDIARTHGTITSSITQALQSKGDENGLPLIALLNESLGQALKYSGLLKLKAADA